MASRTLQIRGTLQNEYPDVFTAEALTELEALSHFDADRKEVMQSRIERRTARARNQERMSFLDPKSMIARTYIRVQDARDGAFVGSEIPADLKCQWIQ